MRCVECIHLGHHLSSCYAKIWLIPFLETQIFQHMATQLLLLKCEKSTIFMSMKFFRRRLIKQLILRTFGCHNSAYPLLGLLILLELWQLYCLLILLPLSVLYCNSRDASNNGHRFHSSHTINQLS